MQTGMGQTPAERAMGLGQWGQTLHINPQSRSRSRSSWCGESIPSPPHTTNLPLGSATRLGCDEVHKRRGRLRFLWGREEREKPDGPHGAGGVCLHKIPGSHHSITLNEMMFLQDSWAGLEKAHELC